MRPRQGTYLAREFLTQMSHQVRHLCNPDHRAPREQGLRSPAVRGASTDQALPLKLVRLSSEGRRICSWADLTRIDCKLTYGTANNNIMLAAKHVPACFFPLM